ncbi:MULTISPECIES: YHS domain-containing protein [Acidiplasma]|nr:MULTISPECIES: YHS domain-containing protein [Acidiplasma]
MANIDPVCGMKVDKKIEAEYNGKSYYFCCEHCKNEFLKNPVKYTR